MPGEEGESDTHGNVDNSCNVVSNSGSNDVARSQARRLSTVEDKLFTKMLSYGREIICFCLAITFTALAALHNSPPRISKPPPAKPFFNESSIVLDFYKGHLGAMIERVTNSDYSFIMYYAPWDAESQEIRREFEAVAEFYHSEIFFAAINCWHPTSECRAQYNKIQSYPVLMIYPSKDSGIEYRGISTAPYMIRFLDAFMNPITRITNREQTVQLLLEYDVVVIGFFDCINLAKCPGYKEFYKTAIRYLERDPNRDIVFSIITDATSGELDYGVIKFPSASLLMWNESLSYPDDQIWSTERIVNWISNSIHQPTLWLQPPGIKSLTLAPYLQEGPVLFLFTPRNPLHNEDNNYNLLKQVALEYFNCEDNPFTNDLIIRLRKILQDAPYRYSEKNRKCIKLLNEDNSQSHKLSSNLQQWINDSCCADISINKCLLCKQNLANIEKNSAVCMSFPENLERVCSAINYKIEKKSEKLKCCDKNDSSMKQERNSSGYSTNEDPRSAIAIKHNFFKKDCKKWLTGNEYQHPYNFHLIEQHFEVNLTKLVCSVNKTLAFIAIDSLQYYHFAEGLGIDVLNKRDKTAAVILDVMQESQYVMEKNFSRNSLIEFVNNYTQRSLPRTLRSENSRRFIHKDSMKCDDTEKSKVCISELTTDTFLSTIMDPTKHVVVMYHSPYCAFCSAVSYVYLTVVHYLSKMDHLLFARIDGDNNDLPWEYNMNHFPSILFFPARRKSDSTVFPFSLPITIPNLINFVLVNLDAISKIEALINVCHAGAGEVPDKCVARIRSSCLDIIELLLNDYRRLRRHLSFLPKRTANDRRKLILLKLNHIRDIHLTLSTTDNLREDVNKAQLCLDRFKKYYRTANKIISNSKTNNATKSNSVNRKKYSVKFNDIKDEL